MTLRRTFILLSCLLGGLVPHPLQGQEDSDIWGMHRFRECFGLSADAKPPVYRVTMLEANAPGNVFHDGEQPRLTFQIENLTDRPIKTRGRIDVLRYAQSAQEGDQWRPLLRKLEDLPPVAIEVDIAPRGWRNLTIEPRTPATRGGYALVLDLGLLGRSYLTSYVRTFKPDLQRVQYPRQSLEEMPPAILARLGVQAVRWGISYEPTDSRRCAELWAEIREELKDYHAQRVTVVAEVGAGSAEQPLGRGRPHLNDKGVMIGGKEDLVWLPKCDEDYQKFVYRLVSEFGWPRGPITAIKLWNKPWEGLSISGWGADMLRYRELHRLMGEAVLRP